MLACGGRWWRSGDCGDAGSEILIDVDLVCKTISARFNKGTGEAMVRSTGGDDINEDLKPGCRVSQYWRRGVKREERLWYPRLKRQATSRTNLELNWNRILPLHVATQCLELQLPSRRHSQRW